MRLQGLSTSSSTAAGYLPVELMQVFHTVHLDKVYSWVFCYLLGMYEERSQTPATSMPGGSLLVDKGFHVGPHGARIDLQTEPGSLQCQ